MAVFDSAVLSKLSSRLPPDKYFRRTEVERLGRRLRVSTLSVMTMPVSLELPLSRLLAALHLQLGQSSPGPPSLLSTDQSPGVVSVD